MNYRSDTITFPFGEFTAIEMYHCVQRELQRGNLKTNNIFGHKGVSIKDSLLRCFALLEKNHYNSIVTTWQENLAKEITTNWVVGFQTDETDPKSGKPLFLYVVIGISKKETPMNGVEKDEDAICIITVLKAAHKNRSRSESGTVEYTLCYYKTAESGFAWRKSLNC